MALFTAFAVILSYIETFIPTVGIPGAKLGLANFAVIMVMYAVGNKEAFFINVIRIIIIGLFFGNMFSICFSIAGALVSFIGMVLLKSTKRISMTDYNSFCYFEKCRYFYLCTYTYDCGNNYRDSYWNSVQYSL